MSLELVVGIDDCPSHLQVVVAVCCVVGVWVLASLLMLVALIDSFGADVGTLTAVASLQSWHHIQRAKQISLELHDS